MNRLIAVHAPAATLGDVIILSVELWTESIHVHLAPVQTEETDRLTAEHVASDFAGDAPDAYLGLLDLALADDAGTVYRPTGTAAGGTGTEWRAHWTFAPGYPPDATRLTVTIGDQELVL
jgi:hypothetical protein